MTTEDLYKGVSPPQVGSRVQIYGNSFEEVIQEGEKIGLNYIVLNGDGHIFNKFMNDIYYSEEKYPYLLKIFDSEKEGFEKLKVKVFRIDYNEFQNILNWIKIFTI